MNVIELKTANYESKRAKAIDAAASVFASKGYQGATTSDIAAELGIKQGSLYYYFRSKQDALQEVCEKAIAEYLERMQQVFEQSLPFAEKLTALVAAHLGSYSSDNLGLKVHNEQRLYLPKERRSKLKHYGSTYRQLLEQVIDHGIASGEVRKKVDSHFMAYSIIGICNVWGANILRDPQLSADDVAQQCIDFILLGTTGNNKNTNE